MRAAQLIARLLCTAVLDCATGAEDVIGYSDLFGFLFVVAAFLPS
jgi:hypothetical protein